MAIYLDPDVGLIPEVDPNDQPWCPTWGCGGRLRPSSAFVSFCAVLLCLNQITWECAKCAWTYCGEHALDNSSQRIKGT